MASSSHNVELEEAKFLHKLIQDSKDEPAKLATKLYVILQHMKSSGKEHSMPFQVISRAMETVTNRHGLDLDALKSSRLPLMGGSQTVDPTSGQYAGSSQAVAVPKDSKAGLAQNEMPKFDPVSASRLPLGQSIAGHEYYQGVGTHRSNHESPSSLDTRSAYSQSQDKQMNQHNSKKAATKRKRGDSSSSLEPNFDNSQQLDSRAAIDPRKGKMNKSEPSGPVNNNMDPSSGQTEHFPSLLTGNMRSMLRGRHDGQNVTENIVDSTNISNLMSRAPCSKYTDKMEVSPNQNAPGQQQGGVPGEVFSSRGVWTQNKTGLPFDRSHLHRFSPNVVSGNMKAEIASQQSMHASLISGAFGKVQELAATSNSYPVGELGFPGPGQFSGSEIQKHGLTRGSITSPDGLSPTLSAGKVMEHDGGSSSMSADANKTAQVGRQNSGSEMTMLTDMAPRDTGKSSVSHSATFSGMPFNEQQLKQLRAQCLVFLAFRNGLLPKKLHLEIAFGNIFPKEVGNTDGSRKELNDDRGRAPSSIEPSSASEVAMPFETTNNVPPSSVSKEAEKLKMEEGNGPTSDFSAIVDERKCILATRKAEAEILSQETVEPRAYLNTMSIQPDSATTKGGFTVSNPVDGMENGHLQVGKGDLASSVMGANKQVNPDMMGWSGIGFHNEVSRASLPATSVQRDLVLERRDTAPSLFQSSEQDEEDRSVSIDSLPSPKYSMSEKWFMDQRKRKLLAEKNWFVKQQKTRQRIFTCFTKLKENVSSSEDISLKTKSVIELKKLQLLELQGRLRSDFLNDFFKPTTNDMERLKSYKKHRHGRRIKQLEKYELKMKEKRQKRIRDRQKEFFIEIEVHKERLDDLFKIRRERWKGFNKYMKEFHKRKERIHREKIDRIQREKINLLKINDVEGYLRMVQDAKSDRVKQLLRETEKYLQKLGSKLQDEKAMASCFENNTDEMRTASVLENDTTIENDDEAKHYMESNEKYYLMAHSIKENISEQPTFLKGGKLREYQMNGLRWLVSLYNNNLNGILADEMGLGKTVQVISLICYLMETKNDRGPFLVVVPSSVLPGWESEINFWAPEMHKIVYAGPPEERRRLFKERIVHQKFNILLTTYEYLMNKHDRPKLSKIHWHYVIIDEGHRIKNASCKLNADLKHYKSSHRLLLTGTPLQNNLEELWALLNFLLPNIFNSSEDFSQWFNKPFESNGDNSADEALLSEEENLLIINRLHQVLRPFVLRRLKHKVESELPEKIERLVKCEASAYQKLLMKRVEENLGAMGNSKVRSVHNPVMELRNICNHPYLSQLHVEEVDSLIPQHYLPPIIRLCGKLEMLDRLLPKLKATDHRVLFFSTMTRLLDVMEDYLTYKQYRYLRLDGHTSGNDRGALIEKFNQQGSPFFIFLLSIRAGGVGVNLQAADTVIIFDTDWNPQVDLQAQARAHRLGQKKDVLVLRFETVQTVEEQVRAAAEHKLGVANQSITAGFFDNNTSAEDRREYLESLLRECKKEEAAPVLDDDALNDLLVRSESEIDIFESVDKQRRDEEMANWKKLIFGSGMDGSKPLPPLPSRLVTDDDLKEFYEAMKLYDAPKTGVQPSVGVKRRGESLGGLDTLHYGRGKRAREVQTYEEQWTEEEFEKMCQVDSPESPQLKEEAVDRNLPKDASTGTVSGTESHAQAPPPLLPQSLPMEPAHKPQQPSKDATPPSKRGRGRPRRVTAENSPTAPVLSAPPGTRKVDVRIQKGASSSASPVLDPHNSTGASLNLQPSTPPVSASPGQSNPPGFSLPVQLEGQGRKGQTGGQAPRRGRRKQEQAFNPAVKTISTIDCLPTANPLEGADKTISSPGAKNASSSQSFPAHAPVASVHQFLPSCPAESVQNKRPGRKTANRADAPRRRGRKPVIPDASSSQDLKVNSQPQNKSRDLLVNKATAGNGDQDSGPHGLANVTQVHASEVHSPGASVGHDSKRKVTSAIPALSPTQTADVNDVARVMKEIFSETCSSKSKVGPSRGEGRNTPTATLSSETPEEVVKNQSLDGKSAVGMLAHEKAAPACDVPTEKSKMESDTEADTKELKDNASLVVKAPVQRADSLKLECKIHTGSEIIANSRLIPSGNAITESNMEVDSTCPHNAGDKNMYQGTPASCGDQTGSRVQPHSPSPIELPQTAESDKTNIEPTFKESSKASNTGDNSRVVLSVSGEVEPSTNDSETKKEKSGMTEIYSGNDVEPSLKESPRASDENGRTIGIKDIPAETLDSETKKECPAITEIYSGPGNEVKPSLKESPRTSNSRSVGLNDFPAKTLVSDQSAVNLSGVSFDKADMPSIVTRCSTEAIIVEGPGASENSNNLVASSLVEDTAPVSETATLDEAPIDTCDGDGQAGGNEAKGDLVLEPVVSIATESADIEHVQQDDGALQRPLLVNDREGNNVEIHKMEVDASVTEVPALKDFAAVSASRDPASEVNSGKQLSEGVESTKSDAEVCNKQSSELAVPPLEIAVPVSDILQDKNIEQTRTDNDANESEEKPPLVAVTPMTESICSVPLCQAATGPDKVSDSGQLSCEISIPDNSMEVDHKVHLVASKEEDFASHRSQSPNGDDTDLTVGPCSNQMELSVASPSKVELHLLSQNSCENKTEISSEDSPRAIHCDVCNLESTIGSSNANDAFNISGAIPPSVFSEHDVASSKDEEKASLEYSNSYLLDINSSKAGVACDPSGVTAVVRNHSVARSLPDPTAVPSLNSAEPSARGSLESSVNVESVEGSANALRDVNTDHSEAIIGGPEISQKTDDHGAAPVIAVMAAGNNHDLHEASHSVEGPSSGNENLRDLVSDPIILVASETTSRELMPIDDKLQMPSAVERGDGNGFDVSNVEVDPPGQPASALKDFATESANVDSVLEDHGEMKSSLEIENIGGVDVDRDVKHLEVEACVEQDIAAMPSSMELVPGDYSKMRLQSVASSEGDSIQVGNTKVYPSEAHATSPEVATNETLKGEHVLNDESQELPGIWKTDVDHLESPTVEPNSSEAQASSLQSGDSGDKNLVQRSEGDPAEACNVESNPIDPELTDNNQVRTERQTEDHVEASQLLRVGNTDVSNTETNPTETKDPSSQLEADADASQQPMDKPQGVDETNA